MLYDGLLVVALLMIAAAAIVIPSGTEIAPGSAPFQIYLLAVWWLYFAICWRLGGQTVGMRAWRIHLISESDRTGWLQTLIRFFVAGVSIAAAGAGLLWSLIDDRKRAWHDIASGTRLVVAPRR
jgi:uncharacterized RDD family membrane protein YckC